MKKLFLTFSAVLLTVGVYAQLETPQPSPSQEIEQKVGLTDVKLQYSRPSMKGRKIFGDLVPFDKMWRTGANANTTIAFSDAVNIGKKKVPQGTYAIFAKPGMTHWEIYLYADTNNWGLPAEWDESKVVASYKARVESLARPVETFTISFDDLKNDSAMLGISWENTYVSLPIDFPTDALVMASIDRAMAGPSSADYYSAAVFYLESGKDINKAKEWIDKAIELREQPAFWYHRQQSLIYAKSGDKKGAIKAAQRSLELAEKAGNSDYVALNKKSLQEWGAM
jgi:hypothetical protein